MCETLSKSCFASSGILCTNPLGAAWTAPRDIDWPRTIQADLKHYQPEYKTVIPEQLIGYGRRRSALRNVVLCVDQSGSMAASVVYAGIFGAVPASLPSLETYIVVFDTAVVDLTDQLDDPVELLFGRQWGGGTDIARALTYCQGLFRQPEDTNTGPDQRSL